MSRIDKILNFLFRPLQILAEIIGQLIVRGK